MTGSGWKNVPGGAMNIDIDEKGNPFVSNKEGLVWWDKNVKIGGNANK